MARKVYVALVHYPIYDKNRKLVTTAVTNVDVHDLARSSTTYGVAGLYIVTPVKAQRDLVEELVEHWTAGPGSSYNTRRKEAIQSVSVVADLTDAVNDICIRSGSVPVTIATGASLADNVVSHRWMRSFLASSQGSALLVLGTGWGLETQFVGSMDYRLAPVIGAGEYNHLSVRSATAIILDRLLGQEVE